MPEYRYSAIGDDGEAVTGRIASGARAEAISQLAARSLYVTDLTAPGQAQEAAQGRAGGWSLRRRVPMRARASMLRQLATALKAGLGLLPALQVVAEQAEQAPLRSLADHLAQRVQAGDSLSEAMASRPRDFSRLEVSMVRVGETAGVLDEVMGYLSEFAERDVDVREQVRSAAAYPVFVLSLAAVSVVVIVAVILPRVIGTVIDSTGTMALPAPTRILLGVSGVLRSYGWALAIAAAGAVVGFRAWLRRPAGRLAFDRFKLRIPVLGTALRRVAVGRFARTLGTLSASGILILEALDVLRDTLGNEALAQKIDEVAAEIVQGQSIADPLRRTGQFPPLLIQVIAMGERTGRLDELLLQTAQSYEKETAAALQRVMTVLPAVLIVLLALVIAFILAAVLLPIVEMGTAIPGT
ncbi:MAG TPA: type II secretion system F family protein [Phycisphaerae bacterium]|nr:type II secretion system F family protein [Phycisphaerae bacterium]